jgi:hypothetical protein
MMPFTQSFDDVYLTGIKPACDVAHVRCERVDEQIFNESIIDRIYSQIRIADLIIIDMSGRNPNVFYETGYAHALGKPVILLTQDADDVPFDLKHFPHIIYGGRITILRDELAKRLTWFIAEDKRTSDERTERLRERQPAPASRRAKGRSARARPCAAVTAHVKRDQVFVSYSHRDIKWLKRLQIHLRPLERDNQVRRWDDMMLDAGDDWRAKIREAVALAKVAVLLVSADFIASEFVHTNELPPLLAAAESEGALILPVSVSPSRFEQIKNLSQFQAVNPPSKPLINMTRTQQEQLFVDVTTQIERALKN